jgi:choline dehydrogenase-like flavoprotein
MSEVKADVVIIGSGIAGAMAAWRLAKKGVKVLVLEAGPEIKREDIVQGFSESPHFNLSVAYPNVAYAPRPDWLEKDTYIKQVGPEPAKHEYLRVVGGTTWHWSGEADRMLPNDMKTRSLYGYAMDWPISFDDLEPYYQEAEEQMGVAGPNDDWFGKRSKPFPLPPIPITVADENLAKRIAPMGLRVISRPSARNSVAYDDRPQCEGFGNCAPICPIGAQYAAIVHVDKAKALGARVMANCRVDKLEVDDKGNVQRAVFGRPDGSTGTAVGKIFVLAANGIESPRLLLASAGEKRPKGIANTSDQVGRNFMGHPGLQQIYRTPYPIYSGRGPSIISIITDFRDGESRRNESAFLFRTFNPIDIFEITDKYIKEGLHPPELDEAIRHRAVRTGAFEVQIEQLPRPENRVTLDWGKRDSAGQPRLKIRYGLGDYERRGYDTIIKVCKKFTKALEANEVTEPMLISGHHLMGTLRMGDDPKTSVVDKDCRSHDCKNLFVAGSAVFPSGGTGGPTLTIAALAIRAADAVAKQLAG